MEYTSKVFVAYSKKLLRVLVQIKNYIDRGATKEALHILNELIADTKGDTEA